MAQALKRPGFARRIFTGKEQALWESRGRSASVLAGNFAAKEAVVKALGTGFAGFWPVEVEVLRNADGKPFVVLHGKAKKIAKAQGVQHIHITITNTMDTAVAFAVAEGARFG